MEANEKSLTELNVSNSSFDVIAEAASRELQELNDEPLGVPPGLARLPEGLHATVRDGLSHVAVHRDSIRRERFFRA